MIYNLKFLPSALKEWKKLGNTIREQLKNKLAERLKNPHVPSDKLRELKDHYKIKLRSAGYRLVYKVNEKDICIMVVAIGKRDKSLVYELAKVRNYEITEHIK